jgi:hypothetical protein
MILTAALLLFGLPSLPAHADVCSDEALIFWADQISIGNWRDQAYGTTNEIRFSNRDVSQACGTYTAAWSTAHLSLGGIYGHWVEVGWRERWDCFGGCEKVFYWFTEWGLGGNTLGLNVGNYPCAKIDGEFHRWRVANLDGTNDWNAYFNCLTGNGWVHLDLFDNTTYHTGTPNGETGRRGGNNTGMTDRHRNLQWKNTNNTWMDWNDPSCNVDFGNNWKGVKDSATQYHTIKGTQDC